MIKSYSTPLEKTNISFLNKKFTILLIEDDPDDIFLIKQLLASNDNKTIELVCTSYLSDGLTKIQTTDISVILLDLFLPDSKGIDTIHKVREKVSEIPIIILTGIDDEELAFQAAQKGAQDYLLKGDLDEKLLMKSILYAIERKRIEHALRESEIKYKNLVESSPDIIWSFSSKNGIIYVSSRVETILGYSPAYLYINPWLWQKLIHANDRHAWKKEIYNPCSTTPIDIQYRIKDNKNDWHRFHDRSIDKCIKNDEIIVNCISTDITQRKQYEHRLELADRIISTVDNLVLVADKNGKITFASPSLKRILGYKQKEVLGNKWWTIARKNDVQSKREKQYISNIAKRKMKPSPFPDERIAYDKHGNKHCILWQDTKGPGYTTISIGVDITSHKKTEDELSKLAALVEQAAESIIITDIDGNIEYVNPAFEKFSSYSFQDVKQKNPRILKSGITDSKVYNELWETISSGNTWTGTLINKRKDGKIFFEDAIIFPIKDHSGNIINYAAVKRDITSEKELEGQLHQSQKLEAIGKLAGGIAHDFNNMLTVINGFTELILLEMEPANPLYSDISTILKEGQRASNLTRQLLAFGRKQIIEPRIIDINKQITELDKMMRRLIGEDIKIIKRLVKNVSTITADPMQIQQIIVNLLVNARDAINQKIHHTAQKKIIIETSVLYSKKPYTSKHPLNKDGQYVIISVSDNGTGMDEETKLKLFEPFFTTKKKINGSGLGLSTVYGIVKQNSADIFFESELGKGSIFKIYWPASNEKQEIVHPEPEENLEDLKGRETILLVEDNKSVLNYGDKTLRSLGYNVISASNGIEALEKLKRKNIVIDLLITDVIMPDMDGNELAAKLKKLKPEIKILFTSGYTDNHITKSSILKTGINFMTKPFSFYTLARKVREVIDTVE
jgi:two-component system cell cycle sensor histidine kinase/response regulator CckA